MQSLSYLHQILDSLVYSKIVIYIYIYRKRIVSDTQMKISSGRSYSLRCSKSCNLLGEISYNNTDKIDVQSVISSRTCSVVKLSVCRILHANDATRNDLVKECVYIYIYIYIYMYI